MDKSGDDDDEDMWDASSASSNESEAGLGGRARGQDEEEKFWQTKLRIARDPLIYLIKAKEIDVSFLCHVLYLA